MCPITVFGPGVWNVFSEFERSGKSRISSPVVTSVFILVPVLSTVDLSLLRPDYP